MCAGPSTRAGPQLGSLKRRRSGSQDVSLKNDQYLAVQLLMDFDAGLGEAGAAGRGQPPQPLRAELDGVVSSNDTFVLEAKDGARNKVFCCWLVGRARIRGRYGKAGAIGRQEGLQHAVGVDDGGRPAGAVR